MENVMRSDLTAYDRAVRSERIHNARRAALMRMVIVGAFLGNSLAMVFLVRSWPFHTSTAVLLAYFLLAIALLVAVLRSEVAALLSWFAIPLLDIPLTFAIQLADVHSTRYEGDQGPLLLFLVSLQLLLILFSTLSLRVPVVILSAGMAIVLSALFARWASIPDWTVRSLIVIVAFTAAALYALRRLEALLTKSVTEQARLDRLKRYFSPQVADVLARGGEQTAQSATRTITVLFGDIRDFTTITREIAPERVVRMLNEYHSVMVERIFGYGGTLDKFMGDGIMAYFNAPLDQPDHAERAVRCASSMMEGLEELNGRRAARGEAALRIGIGIHTGPATLGSIGPDVRQEYTAIGETVNLAAHLEQLTRTTGGGILLTESTRAGLGDGIVMEPRSDLRLGEPARAIAVYRLVGVGEPHAGVSS